MKGVNIHLAEECTRHCNYRQDVDLMEVSGLADVARVCKPFDVHMQMCPPELFYKVHLGGKHTVVTYLVMSLGKKLEAAR